MTQSTKAKVLCALMQCKDRKTAVTYLWDILDTPHIEVEKLIDVVLADIAKMYITMTSDKGE